VDRSRRAHRFVRLRQHAVAKLSAVTFVVLILLPFTAPFPTYHLDPKTGHPFEVLPKDFKNKLDSDEGLILPSDWRLSLPAWADISISAFVCSRQVVDCPTQHTVLRL
jgi:hypothetical protein